jgi:hypothetical protein
MSTPAGPAQDRLLPGSWFLAPDLWYGADRSRTDDLLNANQALSQLSYGPALQEPEDRNQEPGNRPGSCILAPDI